MQLRGPSIARPGALGLRRFERRADGEREVMEPKGFVRSDSGAVWGMQLFWPFEAEYSLS